MLTLSCSIAFIKRKEGMMEKVPISQDDLQDVMEMTVKIETFISNVLEGNEQSLSISALMSASINSLIRQCSYKEEVAFYRNVFVELLDSVTNTIELNE